MGDGGQMAIAPHATIGKATLYLGKSEIVLTGLPADSIGACVTDPPYHLGDNRPQQRGYPQRGEDGTWAEEGRRKAESAGGFMGMKWDGGGIAFDPAFWAEVYRVLKPGAYLAAFSGSRTYHRMAVAIEDAGFIVRDMIEWNYGTGFPKSHNISKALDKSAGAARGKRRIEGAHNNKGSADTRPYIERAREIGYHEIDDDTPITELARQWGGYGTALKPGHEPIVLAQKPLEGTYANNVARWGVGALNIDKCRIATGEGTARKRSLVTGETTTGFGVGLEMGGDGHALGRYPPNILMTHSLFCVPGQCDPACPVGQLDKQGGGIGRSGGRNRADRGVRPAGFGDVGSGSGDTIPNGARHGDTGGVSRFFPILDWSEDDYWWFKYVPKPTKRERNAGTIDADTGEGGNTHVTVKPLSVMGWLIDLCVPKGETLIDPFSGSGTTIAAATQRGYASVGIDMEEDHLAIQIARLGANAIKGWT